MAIHHVVRCDNDGCLNEAPLIVNYTNWQMAQVSGLPPLMTPSGTATYNVRSDWPVLDGLHFCSYGCLGVYAAARVRSQESSKT